MEGRGKVMGGSSSGGCTISGGLSYQRPSGSRRSTRPSLSRVGRLIVADAASTCDGRSWKGHGWVMEGSWKGDGRVMEG